MHRVLANQDNLTSLTLTETPLNEDSWGAEVNLAGYTIFRADRANRSHGEVAVYVRHDLAAGHDVTDSYSNGTT